MKERIDHQAIFLSNDTDKKELVQQLLNGKATAPFFMFNSLQGALFSTTVINEFIEEEERHERVEAGAEYNRKLKHLSSGERKKALLTWLLAKKPGFIILDNPFDHLDIASQALLAETLAGIALHTPMVQLVSRKADVLPFIKNHIIYDGFKLIPANNAPVKTGKETFTGNIPASLQVLIPQDEALVTFNKVSVKYEGKPIVNNINWTILSGEFWQLKGPNGSGKTTLLTMITGDNPKAYGQDIFLFGRKKGSGETVWEIKEKIGYLTPAMTDLFSTRHTLEQMIVSGFLDSIGLYTKPTDMQLRLAEEWLRLIQMLPLKNKPFCTLTQGQQRMALIARAMVKHPPLLILDEPSAGLDDHNAFVVTSLINKIAVESTTAILYVSHRNEEGLQPSKIFELIPGKNGSEGSVVKM